MGHAVGDDLLDVHRRWNRVRRQRQGIDDAHAVEAGEPQASVGGPGHLRTVGPEIGVAQRAVARVVGDEVDTGCRVRDPPVQLVSFDADQRAVHLQPQGARVVFDGPLDGVARQPVADVQRVDAPSRDSAQPALGRHPQRAMPVVVHAVDVAGAQPVGARIRALHPPVLETGHPASGEAEPQPAGRVREERPRVFPAERRPGHDLDVGAAQTEEPARVADPQGAAGTLRERLDVTRGQARAHRPGRPGLERVQPQR